jgi:hypothetical protein
VRKQALFIKAEIDGLISLVPFNLEILQLCEVLINHLKVLLGDFDLFDVFSLHSQNAPEKSRGADFPNADRAVLQREGGDVLAGVVEAERAHGLRVPVEHSPLQSGPQVVDDD